MYSPVAFIPLAFVTRTFKVFYICAALKLVSVEFILAVFKKGLLSRALQVAYLL